MNILVFSTDYKPNTGGIAEHTYQIAKHIAKKGHNVTVLSSKLNSCEEFDKMQSFKTYRVFSLSFLKNILLFFYLGYFVLRFRINLVYNAVWNPCGIISCFLSFALNFRYVVVAHGSELYSIKLPWQTLKERLKIWLKRVIQPKVYNHAFKVFAVSNYIKKKLEKAGVDSKKILVFNNGVSLEEFETEQVDEEIINKYNLKGKKIILIVSRLVARKGHDMIIRTLPKVLEKVPNAIYLIAGDGSRRSFLEDLTTRFNLEDNVIFLGFVPHKHLPRLYNSCDVFIMASREEGFGIVFLEANACKKPVIGGRSGGIPDAIIDGETGLLVDPQDPNDIAKGLIKILTNKRLAKKMGENGYNRVKRELTWDKIVSRMMEIVQEEY